MTACLSSPTSRPSPGPQILSSFDRACSLDNNLRARVTTSPPNAAKTRSPRYLGGRASSTTDLTKKSDTIVGAFGASMLKSSTASNNLSNPLATSLSDNNLGVEADSNRDASSHSFARRSRAFDITFFTISKLNSGHCSSSNDLTHSSTSSEANNSSMHSDKRRLNSAKVYWGPISEQPCS